MVDDPGQLDRGLLPEDEDELRRFLANRLPNFDAHRKHFNICMYAMTSDAHFIVDRHPQHENIVLATGFSGHGLKFAPVIGEIAANLATKGETTHPIDFLGLKRLLA